MIDQIRPPSANITQLWTGLSQERLAWAFHAYDCFIDSLSLEVREHFPKGDEQSAAYVVVFGATQVGKTTLILNLMGLSDLGLMKASKVLRGGREEGESATATAMEYRRSADDDWRFSSEAVTAASELARYDDTAMEKALGEVRAQMAHERLQSEYPLTVWIPSGCFDSDKSTCFSARMLDLPGAHAADDIERKHVQKMAQKYVPNADLILLVGRGDRLGFLLPGALDLPGIEDWQIVPNRFRVVTTFSFTAQSVLEAMEKQKAVDAEFFRQRLLTEIVKSELKLDKDAANAERFFPLEFGKSWVGAKPALVTTLQPIITGLKDELQKTIEAAATPSARLRNAFHVHVTVLKIKKKRLKQISEELDRVKQERSKVSIDCESAKVACEQKKKKIAAANYFLVALTNDKLNQQAQSGMVFDISAVVSEVDKLGTNTNRFKSLINEFTSNLKSHFLRAQPTGKTDEERRFWASLHPRLEQHAAEVERLVDAVFMQLRSKLSEYSLDEYYPKFSDDFSNDQQSMRRNMQDSALSASSRAADLWQGWAKERLQKLSEDVESCLADQNRLQSAMKMWQQTLRRLDVQIRCIEKKRRVFEKKMDADSESSNKFLALLDQAYLVELIERRDRIILAPTTAHAFVELLAADQLIKEGRKLRNNTLS